jgi:transcriptional regulator with XRE-family HTH domain
MTNQLREIVRKRELTPYRLGKLAGVDPSIISRFLSGERDPSAATIDRLFAALGLRVAELAHRTRRASGRPEADASPRPPGEAGGE